MTVEIADLPIEDLRAPLREWLATRRWFGRMERALAEVDIEDVALLRADPDAVWFVVLRATYQDGGSDLFAAPLGVRETVANDTAEVIHRLDSHVVVDAISDPESASVFWELIQKQTNVVTRNGELSFIGRVSSGTLANLKPLTAETTNSAVIRGEAEFFKWVRRVEAGPSVELEMTTALQAGGFMSFPELLGGVDYHSGDEPATRLGFLSKFLPGNVDAWSLAGQALANGQSFAEGAAGLGKVTALMHHAMASTLLAPEMQARAVDSDMAHGWADGMCNDLDELFTSSNPLVVEMAHHTEAITERINQLPHLSGWGKAIRIHGDYHLGQVCQSAGEWYALDFEGEPARAHAERRLHMSPLRDVAGMLRSFDYAGAVHAAESVAPDQPGFDAKVAEFDPWVQECRQAFWNSYLEQVATADLVPADAATALALRTAFEVQKALYEVRYELGHRPAWVPIPLRFLAQLAT